jgi:hypothetical protein
VLNPYHWLKQTASLHPPDHDGHFHQKYARYEAKYFPIGTRIFARSNRTVRPAAGKRGRGGSQGSASVAPGEWVRDEPIQPRALVLADDVLFLAGWQDAVAIQPQTGRPLDPARPDPRPCVLQARSTATGEVMAEYRLDDEPGFDGLIAAHGRLYLSLKNGTVVCFGSE